MCLFSSHSFWTPSSLDVPAGVTQEEGHTGFLIHLPSAVRALFFSREGFSHSFPSSTVRSNFLCTNDLIVLHSLGIFIFIFYFFSEKNSVCRDRTHNVSEGYEVTSELPGRPARSLHCVSLKGRWHYYYFNIITNLFNHVLKLFLFCFCMVAPVAQRYLVTF